jgi:hypothetical protein
VRLDPSTAECLVFTYKEGLLSAVAHDLRLRVERFTIAVDAAAWHVDARFDAGSLRVVGVMREGVVHPDELGAGDRRTIEQNVVREVLHADRHPEIRFTSDGAVARGDVVEVRGTLALHGVARPLVVPVRRDAAGTWTAEARLHQPDFGIRPYRAMLGTLRVQSHVVVRLIVSPA